MRKYGAFHSLAEFIGKAIPKGGSGPYDALFVHKLIDGVKRLDAVQQSNVTVTLTVSAGGGIWVTHDGRRLFMILPGQKAVTVLCGKPGGHIAAYLSKHLTSNHIKDTTGGKNYRSWSIDVDGLETIWQYVEALPHQTPDTEIELRKHPRAFPAAARQSAWELFMRSGNMCPGVDRKPHKVNFDADERVEFDHILPYAKGGSSSSFNIRVLCQTCNRLKSARIA